MFKKIFGVLAIAVLLYSCGTKQTESTVEKVNVETLMASIDNYIDKDVVVSGTVSHVCAHGGKRLFLIAENPDLAIKVIPTEELGVFNKDVEGSSVNIYGKVKELRIDDAYIANMETEMKEGVESEAAHTHDGEHNIEHKTVELDSAQIQKITDLRSEVAESGKGYISQYWIECNKIETVEIPAEETVNEVSEEIETEEKTVEAEK
ncbi:MAG: hypothetical protein A2041_03490 [Bacteroidetes bacterium GWA2_31_9b]|nr:MAG: hypothetical protein A2041_03490 [Bacteroidetes bacterium GWA2_31_9b]